MRKRALLLFISLLLFTGSAAAEFIYQFSANIGFNPRVNTPPKIELSVDRHTGSAPLTVAITARVTDDVESPKPSLWFDFGDGAQGTALVHTYRYPGTYRLRATTTDSDGATDFDEILITVGNNPPNITLGALNVTGPAPLTVEYTLEVSDDSDLTPRVTIDYGDGTSGSDLAHTYAIPGTYTAIATATDNEGLTNSSHLLIYVGNNAPELVVTASPNRGLAPLSVVFDVESSDDSGMDPVISFQYGDGESGLVNAHRYERPGVYEARVSARDDWGAITTRSIPILVENNPPVVSFGLAGGVTEAPAEVSFTLTRSDDSGLTPDYLIDYGDGSASGKGLTHTYVEAGSYTAVVTVTDDQGASTTQSVVVEVAEAPLLNSLSVSPSTITIGSSATLSWSASHANGVVISSTTGSGAPSGLQGGTSKTVTPTATGNYTYTTKARNSRGAESAPRTVSVNVVAAPVLNSVSRSPATITLGQSFTLSWSASNHSGVTITSTSASGAPSAVQSGSSKAIKPTAAGSYTYTVKVRNAAGTDSAAKTVSVTVVAAPTLSSANVNDSQITVGESFTLNWSAANHTHVTITGTSGGGAPSGNLTGTSRSITPTTTGNKTYTVTAYNAAGTASAVKTVTVNVLAAPVLSSLSRSAATIKKGQSFTLSWVASGHSHVTIKGISGGGAPSGNITGTSRSITPTTIGSKTYTVKAFNADGYASASRSVTVNVVLPKTCEYVVTAGNNRFINTVDQSNTALPIKLTAQVFLINHVASWNDNQTIWNKVMAGQVFWSGNIEGLGNVHVSRGALVKEKLPSGSYSGWVREYQVCYEGY